MQGKDKSQGAQSLIRKRLAKGVKERFIRNIHLLSARQVGYVLPTLFRRHHRKDNPFGEGIHAVNKLELCISPKSDHLNRMSTPQTF